VCANYEKLFSLGFGGIRTQIIEKRAELDTANPSDITKKEFYDAALISLEGAVTYIKRYAKLAYEMAQKEGDDRRKAELIRFSLTVPRWLKVFQGTSGRQYSYGTLPPT
jgi:formate C-acetyltransferase